jgi:aromatic-amino-acid transaminase
VGGKKRGAVLPRIRQKRKKMFERLKQASPDALHEIMNSYKADVRHDKIDLGVGVFRDAFGMSPVMKPVAEAELRLARRLESKAYLPLSGDEIFLVEMLKLVFGEPEKPDLSSSVAAIQATGGTGALRLALELTKLSVPGGRVHLGLPSWPSHEGLIRAAGLKLVPHDNLDEARATVNWDSIEAAAMSARRGDLFVLQGPCHNPSGMDLSREQRQHLLRILSERDAVPLIDAAYVGLGDGLESDLADLRAEIGRVNRAFVAVSCSKIFGLYRERTGVLFTVAANRAERDRVQGQLERISRTMVSMAPAHGAAIVSEVLTDKPLAVSWRNDLCRMHARVVALRSELSQVLVSKEAASLLKRGRGIFALLPIKAPDTITLRSKFGIYLPQSGRINITGLKSGDARRLAAALAAL